MRTSGLWVLAIEGRPLGRFLSVRRVSYVKFVVLMKLGLTLRVVSDLMVMLGSWVVSCVTSLGPRMLLL